MGALASVRSRTPRAFLSITEDMVRSSPRVTNRIQGCGAISRAPWRAALGSLTIPRAHAKDGVAGTLRTRSHPSANEGRMRNIGSPLSPEEPRPVSEGAAGTIGLKTPLAVLTANVEEPQNTLDSKRPHTSSYRRPHGKPDAYGLRTNISLKYEIIHKYREINKYSRRYSKEYPYCPKSIFIASCRKKQQQNKRLEKHN